MGQSTRGGDGGIYVGSIMNGYVLHLNMADFITFAIC